MFKEHSPFLFESFMRLFPLYGLDAASMLEIVEQVYASVPKSNREQVLSFLIDWILQRYVEDFKDRSQLWLQALQLIPSEQRAPAINVKEEGDRMYPRVLDLKLLTSQLDKKRIMAFQRWSSRTLCETISLVGHEQFCAMPPHEMCGDVVKPFLNKQIDLFSRLSNLVVWSIVKAVFPLALLKKFIKLAHIFFKMNNLHALGAIITGLNSGHVQALKKVWEDLPVLSRNLFEKYETLVSPIRNFAAYRAHLESLPLDEPCYPYLAVLMRDLMHINDGNPTFVNETLINYAKVSLLGSFIDEWRVFQGTHYNVTPNLKVVQWLGELDLVPDMSGLLLDEDSNSSGSQSPSTPSRMLRKASDRFRGKFSKSTISLSQVPSPPSSQETSPHASSRSQSDIRRSGERKPPDLRHSSSDGQLPTALTALRSQSEIHDQSPAASSEDGPDLQVGAGSHMSRFLEDRGLRKYETHFEKHSIRRGQLKEINEYDLIAMGITDKDDRHKLVHAIRGHERKSSSSLEEVSAQQNDVDESEGDELGDIDPNALLVKVAFAEEIKSILVNPAKLDIPELVKLIGEAYQVSDPTTLTIKLLDFEGDLIRLKKQADLDYALLHCRGKSNVVFQIFQ